MQKDNLKCKIFNFTLLFYILIFQFCIVVLFALFPFVPCALASDASLSNTGFIKSGIWYSKDPFYTGDKVRIYSIVFNGSSYDLLGDAQFSDNDKVICTGSLVIASGNSQEVWCDWTATLGEHKITAKIINSKIAPIGETPVSIILENNISGVSERVVKENPEKETVKKVISSKAGEAINSLSSTSSSQIEEKIKDSLQTVKSGIGEVVPSEIKKEDVVKGTDKILSYVPSPIKDVLNKITEKTGIDKLKDPISFLVDFFIAVYKFMINDPLLIVILFTLVFIAILKAIYNKITGMY